MTEYPYHIDFEPEYPQIYAESRFFNGGKNIWTRCGN